MLVDVGPFRYRVIRVPEMFKGSDGEQYLATIDDAQRVIFISTLCSEEKRALVELQAIAEARQRLLERWSAKMLPLVTSTEVPAA